MPSNVFRFDESWAIPSASVEEVYDVLARGELLPLWWKGVYLEAVKLTKSDDEPKVGDRVRAKTRGFLPYELNFIVESVELEPGRRVVVKTIGDFDRRWSAFLTPREGGVHVDLVWEVTVLRRSCACSRRYCARPLLGTTAGQRRAGRRDCGSIWRRRGDDCQRDAWRCLSVVCGLSAQRSGAGRPPYRLLGEIGLDSGGPGVYGHHAQRHGSKPDLAQVDRYSEPPLN
jgi:uncharacterized protein YndB with AHSA1/START domain